MKKYIAIIASMMLAAVSCNILDTTPGSQIGTPSFFKTENDLKLFSNAFYDQFDDKNEFYQEQSDHYVNFEMSAFLKGGDFRSVPASGGGWSWTMLRRINNLLYYIDQCPDEKLVKEYTALARFFRAYFYFEKVKRFSDVPWVEAALDSDSEELQNPRSDREFVVSKLIDDLDAAIEGLSETKNVYRVTKWTAIALKAQVCLFEGTYRKYHSANPATGKAWTPMFQTSEALLKMAEENAERIMTEGGYSLAKDYLMLFANENADVNEMILALRFEQSLSRKNNTSAFALMPTQGMPGLTKKFVDSFLMADGSRFTDKEGWETMEFLEEMTGRDPRLACCTRVPGYHRIGQTQVLAPDYGSSCTGYQIVKFVMDPSLPNVDRVTYSYNDLPLIRLAEIYLIYAEAKAELGTLSQADLDKSVNIIRDRVKMPHMDLAAANANPDPYLLSAEYGYSNPVLTSSPNVGVILEIRRERAVELAQEGKRIDDLMRWKEGLCLNQPFYGPYFHGEGSYDLTGDKKTNLILYISDKPAVSEGVDARKIGEKATGTVLSEGTYGYVDTQKGIRHQFNEDRDYIYPIPSDERQLNKNLTQNPGWNDGLSF